MRYKGALITTTVLFLLINTSYYWEGKIGGWAIISFLLLVIVYLSLFITLIRHLYFGIKERFKDKQRLLLIITMTAVLCLIYYKPYGLIDFDKLEGRNVLVAGYRGVAGCRTTFVLKDSKKFVEEQTCFGVYKYEGNYEIKGDTFFFSNVKKPIGQEEWYKFAVIKNCSCTFNGIIGVLRMYRDRDSLGMNIYKNELKK